MKSQGFSQDHEFTDDLTWREQSVLTLMAERLSNREIAARLHLAESTVKDYVGKILSKLYAKNRRDAVEMAKALGLIGNSRKAQAISPVSFPAEPTPFIGRRDELVSIRRILAEMRLLTLTGPGGIGKTRLANKAAEELAGNFDDGCFFVSLAPIRSTGDLIQAIAEAVKFPIATQEDPLHQLLRYLQNRQLLLVMDNFEHLLSGGRIISQILQAAPRVKVLATSRERLNLHGEIILNLGGLALSNLAGEEALGHYDSVALFVQSAARVRPEFDPSPSDLKQINHICQMVQGMPLAIELAASWIHVLFLDEIATELDKGLDILVSDLDDVPLRHRSIRASFDHSWALMDPTEQEILMRLSVFRSGFTRQAAQQMAGASLQILGGFVNKSLLHSISNSGRFEMHELLRQYAQERLEQNLQASASAYQAHASYFADFMQSRWEHLKGKKQLLAIAELEGDLENIRASWRYYIDQADAGQLQKYMNSFWFLYWIRGWNHAAIEIFGQVVAALNQVQVDGEAEVVRATALAHQAFFLGWLGLAGQGYRLVKESLEILERFNFSKGLVFAYNSLILLTYILNRYDEEREAAKKLLEVARASGDPWWLAFALSISGTTAHRGKDYVAAERSSEASLKLSDEIGDAMCTILSLTTLGHLAVIRGDFPKAKSYYLRWLSTSRQIGFVWSIGNSTKYLGQVALLEGKLAEAETYFIHSLQIAYDLGLERDITNHFYEFARLRMAQERPVEAVEIIVLLLRQSTSELARLGQGRIRDNAEALLSGLKAHISPEDYAAALQRGAKLEIDQAMRALSSK